MGTCKTPGCENPVGGCAAKVCHCTGDCELCPECRAKKGSSTKAWDMIRGEGSTVAPFIVTEEDIRKAREGDRYIDKRDPKHPCHLGCTHIWNSNERVWRCIHCGDPDRARPAPTILPSPRPALPTPNLPTLPWSVKEEFLQASCCPCRAPLAPGQTHRTLGINCQCQCHGRSTC